MKTFATLTAVILLSLMLGGCRGVYGQADDQVLCHPKTHQAFYVKKGVGQTSFIEANPALDPLCKP